MVTSDWSVYESEWSNGQIIGKGYSRNSYTGIKYLGLFKNGKPEGHGEETSPDGTIYVGNFKNG